MNEKMPTGCSITSSVIGAVIGAVIGLAIPAIITYFLFPISPDKVYGWWGGIWQGLLVIPNLIISIFKSGWHIIAPEHTTAYLVWYWISVIWVAIFGIITIARSIIIIRASSK